MEIILVKWLWLSGGGRAEAVRKIRAHAWDGNTREGISSGETGKLSSVRHKSLNNAKVCRFI